MSDPAGMVVPGPRRARAVDVPAPEDLADRLVAAVCRPADVERVRAAVADAAPDDLAGLVAAVDQHQPMTLEVVVDVLAELGVAPSAVAAATAVDVEDVLAMLGGPLGDPPAPRVAGDARIIEVVAPSEVVTPSEVDAALVDDGSDEPGEADTGDAEGATGDDVAPDVAPDAAAATPSVAVRIDEVAEDEAVARTVADLEEASDGRSRARMVLVVLLVLVVVAALVTTALLWWP